MSRFRLTKEALADLLADGPDQNTCPVVGVYLVIYHRDLRPVYILAVLHGKRNLKKLLGEWRVPPGGRY